MKSHTFLLSLTFGPWNFPIPKPCDTVEVILGGGGTASMTAVHKAPRSQSTGIRSVRETHAPASRMNHEEGKLCNELGALVSLRWGPALCLSVALGPGPGAGAKPELSAGW